ncbi:MAG: hypothetical protein H0V12_11465, partial [Chloroflexi bacterium]|nr:hypothetical protein [Chloroflexota bacterium]
MRNYAVFGGILRSELDFPDLSPADSGAPDWFLRTADAPAPDLLDAVTLGTEEVDTGIGVRLLRSGSTYRLVYDDSGSFDVVGSRSITWYPGPSASAELARLDVIGRVLALALHADGWLPLHGSAVA